MKVRILGCTWIKDMSTDASLLLTFASKTITICKLAMHTSHMTL